MKRSEAVDIIIDVIDKALIKYGASGGGFKPVAGHNILAELLEAGMLPPRTYLENCSDPDLQYYVKDVDIPYWVIHGWDDDEND